MSIRLQVQHEMFSTKLASLLTQYGINNWRYHEDINDLSILILGPEKFNIHRSVYRSLINGNELTIIGDIEKNPDSVVMDIRQFIRKHSRYVPRSLSLLTRIESLKHEICRKQYQENTDKLAIDLIRNHGFDVTDG